MRYRLFVQDLWRVPAIRAVAVVLLLASATGILQGYVVLGGRTTSQHGMEDFGVFYASATRYLERGTLYGPLTRPGAPRATDGRNLNPPHANIVLLPFALVPPSAGLLAWLLINICALADTIRVGIRELRWRVLSVGGLASGVFLLAWAPTAALVITFQLGILVAWLTTRAWVAARRGNWPRVGWWLGAAMSVKVFLLIFVPFLVQRRQWRALRNTGLAIASALALGALVFSPASYIEWSRQFTYVTWHGHYMNASIWGVMSRTLGGLRMYEPLAIAPPAILPTWIAASLVILLITYRRIGPPLVSVDAAFAGLLTAALLVSPLGWVYYFWIFLLPVCAILAQSVHRFGTGDVIVWFAVATGLLWHASATLWGQPSGWATLTIASPYFWSLAASWTWIVVRATKPG